jgi:methionine biosynthesis protein MetW
MRSQIFFKGAMPVTDSLPYRWYDTPNIHFCTIRDFIGLVDEIDAQVLRAEALNASGSAIGVNVPWWFWNLFGEQAVFLLERK